MFARQSSISWEVKAALENALTEIKREHPPFPSCKIEDKKWKVLLSENNSDSLEKIPPNTNATGWHSVFEGTKLED